MLGILSDGLDALSKPGRMVAPAVGRRIRTDSSIMHAKGATVIRAAYTISDDDAVIVVEDDGPGIAEDKKEEIFSKGIGAGGSTSLFLSREILSITGISIRETGGVGKGARFEIRVPKGSYRSAVK